LEVGGFCPRYWDLGNFDLITKIHLNKKFTIVYCRRVVVDFEEQKYLSKKILSNLSDLLSIIYHYHGFRGLFNFGFFKEIINFFRFCLG